MAAGSPRSGLPWARMLSLRLALSCPWLGHPRELMSLPHAWNWGCLGMQKPGYEETGRCGERRRERKEQKPNRKKANQKKYSRREADAQFLCWLSLKYLVFVFSTTGALLCLRTCREAWVPRNSPGTVYTCCIHPMSTGVTPSAPGIACSHWASKARGQGPRLLSPLPCPHLSPPWCTGSLSVLPTTACMAMEIRLNSRTVCEAAAPKRHKGMERNPTSSSNLRKKGDALNPG